MSAALWPGGHHRFWSFPCPSPPGRRGSMSTAGKVLVVLILISSVVWLVLASKVAVINANGAQMRDKFEQDFAKLEADSAQNRINLRLLKDQIAHTQVQMDRDLAVIRSRVAEIEKARSGLLEVAARAK